MLAWIFRTLNARIITTRFEIVRKPLKVLLLISQKFARRSRQQLDNKPSWVVIDNFDADLKLKIDRSRTMGASFYWAGFHEFREFIFMHRFLKGDMVALDVGANLGEYTLFMAKRLGDGKVFSFEPMTKMVELLEKNIALNGFKNVQVCPFGLADRNYVAQVHEVDDPHEGLGTFYLGERKSKQATNVELRTLDSVFGSLNVNRIDFIKMDIEGSELHALKGGSKTMARFRPYVLIEINAPTYNAAGYSVADVSTFFLELNYAPHLVSKTGKLAECSSLPDFGNIIFVPQ